MHSDSGNFNCVNYGLRVWVITIGVATVICGAIEDAAADAAAATAVGCGVGGGACCDVASTSPRKCGLPSQ